jgi:hypothetical protein
VTLYGPNGQIQAPSTAGQPLAAGAQQYYLLSSLLGSTSVPVLAVHVSVQQGRVSAALLDAESGTAAGARSDGTDFVPETTQPASHIVIPGIPAEASGSPKQQLQLYLMNPGQTDATVNLHWIGTSTIVPSGDPQVTAKAGQVTTVDLSGVQSPGESAALRLDATNGGVVAGVRVVRSDSNGQDLAFGGAGQPITGDSVVTDNRTGGSDGWQSQMLLTAPGATANAEITTVGGGSPKTTQVTVPGGTTKAVPLSQPSGSAGTPYATIVSWRGGGQLYGARLMSDSTDGPQFTVQGLLNAVELARIPAVSSDLSGLVRQRR